jgi:5-methylthioribose kinase
MTDFRLSVDNAVPYLRRRGVLSADEATVESLGGGVSNVVLRVSGDDDCVVAKQPLSNLAVEADWPADVDRVHNEADAARAYARLLCDAPDVAVPGVTFEDESAHVVTFECAPTTAEMWKQDLLDGRVNVDIARRLGSLLATVHDHAPETEGLRERFGNDEPFVQLRVTPYHRTVAEEHPDVADTVEAEIDRMAECDETLVHGDFSPKNVLCDATTGDEPTLWVLDFEVAHWGDPAFDAAFMLNHLFIKSVYNDDRQSAYFDAAREFWTAYRADFDSNESDVVTELAILMLARVDGRSPVEYVTRPRTKETLRTVSKRCLREDIETVDDFAGLVAAVSDR